ncbi:MAG: nucleoside deaminase [Clostridia bacterium]|mgnify:CR=1 FL=1|nr:nucleoside deaminase [Clostridia bacterium]
MNKKFMTLALEQAKTAAKKGEVPIGAVVIKDDKVIAAAHNMCEALNDPTAHAEILAIRAAAKELGDFRLTGAQLYVTLEPCPMCAGAAINARIGEIIFGAADPAKGALGSVTNMYSFDFPNRPTVYGGINEKECLELLKEFFKEKRKS